MPEAPKNGYLRPAVRTAGLGIGTGWAASALVMALSGSTDFRVPARIWLITSLLAGQSA